MRGGASAFEEASSRDLDRHSYRRVEWGSGALDSLMWEGVGGREIPKPAHTADVFTKTSSRQGCACYSPR